MIRMPAIAETGSAVSAFRSRVRSQDPPPTPDTTSNAHGAEESGDRGTVSGAQRFELQEDPSFWKDHNVQVVIRIRPLSSPEMSLQGHNRCVRQDTSQSITWTGHPESRFTFDLVADEYVSQEKLFKAAGVPMVENCVAGYNSCMFAYGQTGSGKTHTMLGDIEEGTRRHNVNCGMTPRVFEYLFSRIQKEKEARRAEKLQFICKCSFLEIYNEQILDLLDPSAINLQLREDAKKGVHVENLMEFEVASARDVMQQLIQGAANRKVAATNMNRASSRSHSVFTCVIESKCESQGVIHHRFSRLNLVDLAGSERQKSSGAEGDRFKEATNINKSLSTLGLVIMNLVSVSNKKSLHVPYRDSKLTFLLQDSLGGNSKTTIIANISPSNCCALETLSTLKFAQRAKFIRNNAIVNEDASGDVLAMRLQIQQLKKEVNRLRALVNGRGENLENNGLSSYTPASLPSFKWEGEQGPFSPLTFDKRLSERKEYEAALVAAFRRDQQKEAELKALTAGKEAAEQLATQKTEEVRGLKMRLRFREEGIKRLESVASGKLSAVSHLLQEKEEFVKELEVLKSQVDRNPEVTRFAMENLQLKEELRRLQSFVEEGEREMMNEQITVLQDKLLEALDWKLMHEKDSVAKDLSLSLESSTNEENEFLRLQAIQNQREVEALRKNLVFCLEAKERLERRVDELVSQLEERMTASDAQNQDVQHLQMSGLRASETRDPSDSHLELKAMVDAIAAASQREAEAHETAIILANENEELRMKLKVLIEDNNKLIELYESAVTEGAAVHESSLQIENAIYQDDSLMDNGNRHLTSSQESYHSETKDFERLEHQLHEMHEENDKLMGLYENAMKERDEFKRLLSSYEYCNTETLEEIILPEKLVEVQEFGVCQMQKGEEFRECPETQEEIIYPEKLVEVHGSGVCQMQEGKEFRECAIIAQVSEENLCLLRNKLESIQDKLAIAEKAFKLFGSIEKAISEKDELSVNMKAVDHDVQLKQQELIALQSAFCRIQERLTVTNNKFVALKLALQSLSPKAQYCDQREIQARGKVDAYCGPLEQKKEELRQLKIRKDEIDASCVKARESESELRNNIDCLKLKFHEAEARKESKSVLFAIDNLDKADTSLQKKACSFGRASELLKSEEERGKMVAEMKQLREKLASVRKEFSNSMKISESVDAMIQSLESGITSESSSLREAEIGLQKILEEKQMLSVMREEGIAEAGNLLVEYQECLFECELKENEIKFCEEDLDINSQKLEELRAKRLEVRQKVNHLRKESRSTLRLSNLDAHSWYVSEKLEEELGVGDVQRSVTEAKSLLPF